ncbi:hypothetical protein [Streptomyces sp. BPTC-684]|uniref:hypothetical protein n=1 Tax=Streptomyces sp. BPTC-684 TaxID=3043734 RepID=UPI0024B26A22|nr:hypothetical protein [Streptomyces sp. BPTC-684]WHM40973.1 hypothetical protein QIY60_31620 [Streptomyces sp. BPTC-684]
MAVLVPALLALVVGAFGSVAAACSSGATAWSTSANGPFDHGKGTDEYNTRA